MASNTVAGFWLYGMRVLLVIPAWISEPLSRAAAMGAERFSRAAEVAVPLLAAEIIERFVKEYHKQAYYRHLFEFGCPGAAWLSVAGSRSISLKEVKGSNEVVERISKELGKGEFIAWVGNNDRGFYALQVDFRGKKCSTFSCDEYCEEEEKHLGELWLGKLGRCEILLGLEHVRLNIDLLSKLSSGGWDPHSFLNFYVAMARSWGGTLVEEVTNAVWWAVLVTRAALHEVYRLSLVAADGRAAAEVIEEVKQAALAAYNTAMGFFMGSRPSRRSGTPADNRL